MSENKKYKSIPTSDLIKYISEMEKNWNNADMEIKKIAYDKIKIISVLHMKKIIDIVPPEVDLQKLILEKLTNLETDMKEVKTDVKILNDKVDKLEVRMDNLENRMDRVEQDIKDIKNCPTIKKELKSCNN